MQKKMEREDLTDRQLASYKEGIEHSFKKVYIESAASEQSRRRHNMLSGAVSSFNNNDAQINDYLNNTRNEYQNLQKGQINSNKNSFQMAQEQTLNFES